MKFPNNNNNNNAITESQIFHHTRKRPLHNRIIGTYKQRGEKRNERARNPVHTYSGSSRRCKGARVKGSDLAFKAKCSQQRRPTLYASIPRHEWRVITFFFNDSRLVQADALRGMTCDAAFYVAVVLSFNVRRIKCRCLCCYIPSTWMSIRSTNDVVNACASRSTVK